MTALGLVSYGQWGAQLFRYLVNMDFSDRLSLKKIINYKNSFVGYGGFEGVS